MIRFLEELQRRKVYRTAAGYTVAAWLVIQVVTTVFPVFALPGWSIRLVVALVLAGFPLALFLAWAFEIGPRGLAKTDDLEDARGSFVSRRGNLAMLIGIGLLLSVAAAYFLVPRLATLGLGKSIAVLPFDNFTSDKENEHFADGLQDDVLTSLARINDLKVISRTSVMQYRGQTHNIPEIARTLGVSSILEGSVRRIGQKVRVTVQLIDAGHDRHVWAQTYDRDLTDVFAIQSELAREIAATLHAELSPAEAARIQERPTTNNEAYRLYQQAHILATRADETLDALKQVEQLYEEAIKLDPKFALAFARLSQLHSWVYYLLEPTPDRLGKAKAAADQARQLQPDLPETHLALGYLAYYGNRDYAGAMSEFEIARRGLPNDPGIFRAIGSIERRQGKWNESIRDFQKAVSLSPGDADLVENLGLTYQAVRDYPAAAKAFDRAIEIVPKSFEARSLRAQIDIESSGDLTKMKELLASQPNEADSFGEVTLARFNVAFAERRFDEALAVLWRSPLENLHGKTSTPLPKSFLAGQVYRLIPDPDKARTSYEQALDIAQRAIAEGPNDAARYALLGLIYAGLGQKAEAIAAGNRALELLPEAKDALDGPIFVVSMARIYAITGESEKAIDLLAHSLQTPSGTTVHELRLDPTWDVLRSNPRFQALVK